MARQADTSWHEAFLAHVSEGMAYQAAAKTLKLPYKTLYYHFRINPAFRAKADAIRAPRYQTDTSWHDRLPAMIAAGLTRDEAARLLGINRWTIWQHTQMYPQLRDAIEEARQRSGSQTENKMTDQIQGYEAEPQEVQALLDVVLADIAEEPDPAIRYVMLTKELVTHQALVSRIADERARAVAAMHKPGGLSYQQIADALLLGTRGRAQQLVNRGRVV